MTDNWATRAACAGMETDLFFPPVGGNGAMEAKAICGMCTVRPQCLASVIHIDRVDDHGIFGGLSRMERHRIRLEGAA